MSYFGEFLADLQAKFGSTIQIGMVGQIFNFDRKKMRADAKPLLKISNAQNQSEQLPNLSKIPVQLLWSNGYYIRPDYRDGDLVWITFATHSISAALTK